MHCKNCNIHRDNAGDPKYIKFKFQVAQNLFLELATIDPIELNPIQKKALKDRTEQYDAMRKIINCPGHVFSK